MTYTELAIAAVLVTVVLDLVVFRTRLVRSRAFWVSYAIMLAFQLVVDGLLAGLPVVRYRATAIVGARIAYAPVEDVLFGFSLVLSAPIYMVVTRYLADSIHNKDVTHVPTALIHSMVMLYCILVPVAFFYYGIYTNMDLGMRLSSIANLFLIIVVTEHRAG